MERGEDGFADFPEYAPIRFEHLCGPTRKGSEERGQLARLGSFHDQIDQFQGVVRPVVASNRLAASSRHVSFGDNLPSAHGSQAARVSK